MEIKDIKAHGASPVSSDPGRPYAERAAEWTRQAKNAKTAKDKSVYESEAREFTKLARAARRQAKNRRR